MEPIKITPVSEKLYSRTPERGGGYREITERIGVTSTAGNGTASTADSFSIQWKQRGRISQRARANR